MWGVGAAASGGVESAGRAGGSMKLAASRRSRLARNPPGLVIWSGQDRPVRRMSVSRTSWMSLADHTAGSMPAAVMASQMVPMWPWRKPRHSPRRP